MGNNEFMAARPYISSIKFLGSRKEVMSGACLSYKGVGLHLFTYKGLDGQSCVVVQSIDNSN